MALTNNNYNNLPQMASIQGFWRFEDNYNDESDNGNDLTNSGVSIESSGKIGKAGDFEAGDSDYASIADGDQTGLDITGSFTFLAWIKIESFGDNRTVGSKYDVNGDNRSWYVYITNADQKVKFNVSNNGSDTTADDGDTALVTGTWYQVGGVYNGSKLYTVKDGGYDSSGTNYSSGIYNSAADFNIGRWFENDYFDGLIDEVIVWNTALSDTEVAEVYAITSEAGYKKSSGMLLWFFSEAYKRHDRLWTPKGLVLPKGLGFSH